MINPFRALLVVLATFAVSTLSTAQGPATGVPAFGTVTGDFDHINLANLNMHLGFPILNKAGRGTPFVYNLSYDSSVWAPVSVRGFPYWVPESNWGWMTQSTALTGSLNYSEQAVQCEAPNPYGGTFWSSGTLQTAFVYADPSGTRHTFTGGFSLVIAGMTASLLLMRMTRSAMSFM